MTNGVFTEELKTGGKLVVSAKEWEIKYYFSGPDLRYNGTFFTISSKNIDNYVRAWKNNYQKYTELKKSLPKGTQFQTVGEMGMNICINFYSTNGVCLTGYKMPVTTELRINDIIENYNNAKLRAVEIQKLLISL